MKATAHCHSCDWTAAGTQADVDKAADRHVGKGHPVATVITP